MDNQLLHEKILYPVVRVRTAKAGGSGTVIYCRPDPDHDKDYLSFVLTNHHVIEDAITYKKAWNSLLKANMDTEYLSQVDVEVFDYYGLSHVSSSNSYKAEIVAYDKSHDIAVLRVLSPKPLPYVADLFPKGKEKDIKLFTPVWICGASLLHNPFANPGFLTSLNDEIDNKPYWMTNANAIFGNSGGACFLAETGQFLGIPARVTTLQLGFGFDVTSWMSFICPIPRIYGFLEEQELQFVYDPTDTYKAAVERRKAKQEESLQLLRPGGSGGKSKEEDE